MALSSGRLVMVITLLAPARVSVAAQDTVVTQAPPSSTAVVAVPPTPEQARYLDGLRTVARGVAQLKDGIDRVTRTQAGSDTVSRRRAAQRLGGLCSTARTFIATGRPRMQATAYEDSMRVAARQLAVRVDSLSKALPTCATSASKAPAPIAADLVNRLKAYETALAAFRAYLFPPKADSIKTPSQQ